MPKENRNKIIKDVAKEILSPHGIFQKGQSRTWLDDNGWFITVIEYQPSHWATGTYLNVGMDILWEEHDRYSSFVLSIMDRVRIDNGDEFIEYENDQQFIEKVSLATQMALDMAIHYRKFQDLSFADQQINSKPIYHTNWSEQKRSVLIRCLADNDKAKEYINNYFMLVSGNDPLMPLLKKYKDSIGTENESTKEIRDYLVSMILKQREYWRSKGLKKLHPDSMFLNLLQKN